MSELVTVVTAFVDLDREHWKGKIHNRDIPVYIARSTESYLKNFERLSKIKNPMVVYTTQDMFRKILEIRSDSIELVDIEPILLSNRNILKKIYQIQSSDDFINFVKSPELPEYWNPDYVLINYLKSFIVSNAITRGLTKTSTVAWLDFGYTRPTTYCPEGFEWKFTTHGMVNLFAIDDVSKDIPVFKLVQDNHVMIQGCHIVAPSHLWKEFSILIEKALQNLFSVGLIDDDQTLLYMAYKSYPTLFKINHVSPDDWFVIFKNFNN